MTGRDEARIVRPHERVLPEHQTPGMEREEAFHREGVWAGIVTIQPGELTGWHHHGEYDTYVFVLDGVGRLEYGPGGQEAQEAHPGDFMLIPRGTVHREGSAAGSRGARAVLFRVGQGQVTFNLDGPSPP